MYKPINMTDPITLSMLESKTSLNLMMEDVDSNYEGSLFTEAVFAKGRDSLKVILEDVKVIKEELETAIEDHEKKKKTFNPKSYWRSLSFKKLENDIKNIFGFRHASIEPYVERYNSSTKEFETKDMNCRVYHQNRFPVDGLVTDKGFYDSTHSLDMMIFISLGLVKTLTPEELVAVFLHEFGHNIDPASMDIKYAKVNILSKYLTDRKGDINQNERKAVSKGNSKLIFIPVLLDTLGWSVQTFMTNVKGLFKKTESMVKTASFGNVLTNIFGGKSDREKKVIEKIKKAVREDHEKGGSFSRQNYGEAFADNFARMYGYGPELASGLHKLDKWQSSRVNSWSEKESMRQRYIIFITQSAIKNEHKTGVHRVKALIKEYYDDINNPNTPKAVKKALETDVKELEKILDEYTNNFSEFQNKVNKAIAEELDSIESSDDKKVIKESSQDVLFEYYEQLPVSKVEAFCRKHVSGQIRELGHPVDYLDKDFLESGYTFHMFFGNECDAPEYLNESRKAWEKMQKEINAVTSTERAKFYKLFGKSKVCSLAKDKDGYYVRTHRARSKSYKDIEDIPKKDVNFVRSTA